MNWIMKNNLRRWILFLPLSILCVILGGLVWDILDAISIGKLISVTSFAYKIYHIPLWGMIAGFIFVYVGGYIAPHNMVKTILLGMLITICLLSGIIQFFVYAGYWQCLLNLFIIVGGFIGHNYLNNKNEKHTKKANTDI